MKTNQPTRNHAHGRHAIVIGGSMAGLLAARLLSNHFEQVTILERDAIHDRPEARKGQPQARHLHGLLAHGLEIYNEFFPGLNDDLVAGGAVLGDMGRMMRWYQFDGFRLPFNSGLTGALLSRAFLEWQIRRRVLALPNVTLQDGCGVEGLVMTADQARVTGVRLTRRQPQHAQDVIMNLVQTGYTFVPSSSPRRQSHKAETMYADLVIDAGGRGSATPKWLAALGYARPEEWEVRVNVGYATRIYCRQPGDLNGAELLMIGGTPPHEKRSGLAFPIEGDRWVVTLAGMHGDHCPADERSFLAFARSLPVPDLYNLLTRAEPLSEIVLHKFPASLWRRYEKLVRFPEGYLVMGDAICSFNPIYGQGMTSAAMQARLLDDLLAQRTTTLTLWRDFFKQSARVIDNPWRLAVGEDFRFPETTGPKALGTNLINGYVARVHRATHHDPVVYAQFLRVMNLLESPASLFKPQIMRRVLRSQSISTARPLLDPATGN